MEQNTFNLFNSMGSPAAHLLKGLDCVTSENKRRRASGRHTPRRKSQEKRKKGEKEKRRGAEENVQSQGAVLTSKTTSTTGIEVLPLDPRIRS
jgi:hypothetical protein